MTYRKKSNKLVKGGLNGTPTFWGQKVFTKHVLKFELLDH